MAYSKAKLKSISDKASPRICKLMAMKKINNHYLSKYRTIQSKPPYPVYLISSLIPSYLCLGLRVASFFYASLLYQFLMSLTIYIHSPLRLPWFYYGGV
jgi:hypothetical protein